MPEISEWNKERALAALGIEQIPFTHTNGNVQGYAKKSQVAISPLAELPHKTLFHEVAHVVLLHTAEADISDSEQTPRSLREVEAEAVALLVCESLGLACSEYCRGYIQNWLEGDVIPEKSAQKIFGAADRILKAGINHQAERTQSNSNQPLASPLHNKGWVLRAPSPTFRPICHGEKRVSANVNVSRPFHPFNRF